MKCGIGDLVRSILNVKICFELDQWTSLHTESFSVMRTVLHPDSVDNKCEHYPQHTPFFKIWLNLEFFFLSLALNNTGDFTYIYIHRLSP